MRTIVAGSRDLTNYDVVCEAIRSAPFVPTVIISGTARGVDRLGERYADEHKIPIERYPADWKVHKYAAGVIRNAEMAEVAEALIAVWDGISPGTLNMITLAQKKGILVHIHLVTFERAEPPKYLPLDFFK